MYGHRDYRNCRAQLKTVASRDVTTTLGRRRIVGRRPGRGAAHTEPVPGDDGFDRESHPPPGAPIVTATARYVPFDGGSSGERKAGAGIEVDEQQGRRVVHFEVAEAVEHVVAGVVRPPQLTALHADEARRATAV